MTSPVERISGPSTMSTPGNFANGKTASLTETYFGTGSAVIPCSRSRLPTMTRAATLARFNPVALDTKGTVREARGLTSKNVDIAILYRKLDVHKPAHLEGPGQHVRLCFELGGNRFRQ